VVSELATTEVRQPERINKILKLRVVRKFDRRSVETRQFKTAIVQFPSNRFRLTDDDRALERMLLLSAEALEGEW
jgi:hypothetical protein